jgi:hypothetical protein
MTRGAVRRFGITGAVALVVAASGCTIGDDSTEVIVDDGGDAMAALSVAMGSLQEGSGRFRQSVSFLEGAGTDEEFAGAMQIEGSFDGTDVEAVSTMDFDAGSDSPEPIVTRQRTVGSSHYMAYEGAPSDLPGWSDGTWIVYDLEDPDEVIDPTGGLMAPVLQDSSALLDSVEGLAEAPPVDLDGTAFRVFEGSVGLDGAEALLSSGSDSYDETEGMSTEERARFERIRAYESARTPIQMQVLVGDDGSLRRLTLEGTSDIEPRYEGCWVLSSGGDFRLELEVYDRGAPVEIVAPDPATVRSSDDPSLFGPDSDELDVGEADMLRGFIEDEVREGAWVVGVDPASIAGLSDHELRDLQQRIAEAAEQLPVVETALGPMNRLELLRTVAIGLEMEGVDPSAVEGLDDQQLADLIDSYLEENPELAPTSGDDVESLPEDEVSDVYVEGCPA